MIANNKKEEEAITEEYFNQCDRENIGSSQIDCPQLH